MTMHILDIFSCKTCVLKNLCKLLFSYFYFVVCSHLHIEILGFATNLKATSHVLEIHSLLPSVNVFLKKGNTRIPSWRVAHFLSCISLSFKLHKDSLSLLKCFSIIFLGHPAPAGTIWKPCAQC